MVEKFIQDSRGIKMVAAPLPGKVVVKNGFSISPYIRQRLPIGFILAMFTFFLVNVTWVFFRSQSFHGAWQLLTSMFTTVTNGAVILKTLSIIKVAVIIVLMIFFQWKLRSKKLMAEAMKIPWWGLGIIWAVLLLAIIFSQESSSSFIYFQF